MADVNWHRYECNICLAVGLTGAAVASAVATGVLAQMGLNVVLLVILFLVVWGVLFKLVDGYCASRPLSHAGGATHGSGEAPRSASEAEHPDPKTSDTAAEDDHVDAPSGAGTEAQKSTESAGEEEPAAETKVSEDAATADDANRAQEARRAEAAGEADFDGDGVVEGSFEGTRPEALDGPRGGVADDLKRIKGVGPKMETLCNSLGFYHFDQIANWNPNEVAWVDANLEGFKGRVTRDAWVSQAKLLATGGETEFSKRVDEGDVPSSQ